MSDSAKKSQIREVIRSRRALIGPEQAAGYDKVLSEQFISVKDKDLRSLTCLLAISGAHQACSCLKASPLPTAIFSSFFCWKCILA